MIGKKQGALNKETRFGTVALTKAEGQLCIYQQGKPF